MLNLPKFLVDYKLVIKIKNKLVFLLKLLLQESLKRVLLLFKFWKVDLRSVLWWQKDRWESESGWEALLGESGLPVSAVMAECHGAELDQGWAAWGSWGCWCMPIPGAQEATEFLGGVHPNISLSSSHLSSPHLCYPHHQSSNPPRCPACPILFSFA